MAIPYRFLPYARRGLARAHTAPDTAAGALPAQPRITVGLTLQARRDGNAVSAVSGNVPLRLYGPADIIGIDPRLVVRTDPRADTTDFEPNYLACVDFDPPDFPWLLTPAHADAQGRLRPWLVLVVLERGPGTALPAVTPGQPLPSVRLTAVQVRDELPDLRESWLWAHAQAVSQAGDAAALAAQLRAEPARNVSRLLCPRRLKPRTAYLACVVPATDGGRLRGIGQPVPAALGPAWDTAAPQDLELPVYHHWTFATGPAGDIETLARNVRTPAQYGGDAALRQQLRTIGQREVWVDGDRLLFDGAEPGRTVFEGAMVSIGFEPEAASQAYAAKLQAMLNSAGQRLAPGGGADPAAAAPTLAPPLYGAHPARRHTADAARTGTHWLEGLSLQPRYRLVAGWGAEVVRRHQDEFMQAAWEQLGDILAAERAFSLARLSRDVLKRVEARHLSRLPPHRVLALMAPARARVAVAPGQSLHGRIDAATLPHELFDGAMRRLASPRRAVLRMARWRQRAQPELPSVARQMGAMVERFASPALHLAAIDPNRFVPDGLLGSRSLDAVPLPAVLDERVDLRPHLGLDVTLSGHELQALQQTNAAARALAAATPRRPPGSADVWRGGLLTETHAARVARLQASAGVPLAGDVGSALRHASGRGAEGVLLAVRDGVATTQALRIDGRSGAVRTAGAPLQVHAGSRAQRAPARAAVALTRVATVPLPALRLYGNAAVFATLPPSTLGRRTVDVSIGLGEAGRFTRVPPAGDDAPATITLPPAIRDRATLARYGQAFRDYRRTLVPPAADAIDLRPEAFALADSAARLRRRIDADRTVPARLASRLALGGQGPSAEGPRWEHPFISPSLDAAATERLRYVVPRAFDRVMAYPRLPFPLSRKLEALAPDVFLPGVGVLPSEFVMAVQTNPRFVEALMVGANHEMGREMLWQGLPTDQRGTPLQHFWQRLDGGVDIEPLHRWNAVALGEQPLSTAMVVLLFRGRLLERYPGLSIYAYPMSAPGEPRPGAGDPGGEMQPARVVQPVLRGRLLRDIRYVGFRIAPAALDGHFFIVEEHLTEPRFGFDERVGGGQAGPGWQDVDWEELQVAPGQRLTLPALRRAAPAQGWGEPHAADIAVAALQRPFRGWWRGAALRMP